MTPTKGRKDSITHDPHFCAMFKGQKLSGFQQLPSKVLPWVSDWSTLTWRRLRRHLVDLLSQLQSPMHLDLPRDRLLGIEAHWDKIPQGSSPNEKNLSCQVLSDTLDHPFSFPTYLLNSSLSSILLCLALKWQGSTFLRHDIFHILPVMFKLPTACSS